MLLAQIFIFFISAAGQDVLVTVSGVHRIEIPENSGSGLGFLDDGKQLYYGGCSTISIDQLAINHGCRYPEMIRWSKISYDGSLILATTGDPQKKNSRSFQLDARTGKILSMRNGIWFDPPVAIHPTDKYWVSVEDKTGGQGSETLVINGRDWKTKKSNIYAGSKRIDYLRFSPSGQFLYASGDELWKLDTKSWKLPKYPELVDTIVQITCAESGSVCVYRSPQGYILSAGDALVPLLQLDTILQIQNEEEIAFNSDGTNLAFKGIIPGKSTVAVGVVQLR
jgi:hypothetical protein